MTITLPACRWCRALALLALFLLAMPGAVLAQGGQTASQSCRRQCDQQIRSAAPRDMQVCLVRCGAGEDYLARQHRAGSAESSGRGTPTGAPQRNARSLVAYAGPLPSTGLGLSQHVDRPTAHRMAERECYRRNGQRNCRLLMETQQRCIAVSRAVRGLGLVITNDPGTYQVLSYGVGDGPNLVTAQGLAMQDCAARQEPGTACVLAVSRCG